MLSFIRLQMWEKLKMKRVITLFLMLLFSIATFAEVTLLPKPLLSQTFSLTTALAQRRSVRSFQSKPITNQQLATLLWAAQGITSKQGFRTAPSAGALYPLELLVAENDGLWRYNIADNLLERISSKDLRRALAIDAYRQWAISSAPVDLIMVASPDRTKKKYGHRGNDFVYAEAGHAAQNYLLEATALGLAGVPIGAFGPRSVHELLGLEKTKEVVYIIPTGYRK